MNNKMKSGLLTSFGAFLLGIVGSVLYSKGMNEMYGTKGKW